MQRLNIEIQRSLTPDEKYKKPEELSEECGHLVHSKSLDFKGLAKSRAFPLVSPRPLKSCFIDGIWKFKRNYSIDDFSTFSINEQETDSDNFSLGLPSLTSKKSLTMSQEMNVESQTSDFWSGTEEETSQEKPPFLSSSPPNRAMNPLVMDPRFRNFCNYVPRGSELGLLSVSPPLIK
ncbi:hypothetical protein M0811_01734 [Anaeramoeba ignava]|uniref:Uncharacterized protein n=1 Tax=Anaeramoeba ignava TaxID=1746090 RepID=A0A9Q0R8T9_ANAIG|nr:hypothetical protein M0811_01734 [Anaeramoeba ignava]|eukprot:Anaeramoba_ignava/a227393_31.p1 GENE.a227393_31~~a227393_31.p1  ORF type:complete len:178 (+),score=61.53 a227393_31:89-622(+)